MSKEAPSPFSLFSPLKSTFHSPLETKPTHTLLKVHTCKIPLHYVPHYWFCMWEWVSGGVSGCQLSWWAWNGFWAWMGFGLEWGSWAWIGVLGLNSWFPKTFSGPLAFRNHLLSRHWAFVAGLKPRVSTAIYLHIYLSYFLYLFTLYILYIQYFLSHIKF